MCGVVSRENTFLMRRQNIVSHRQPSQLHLLLLREHVSGWVMCCRRWLCNRAVAAPQHHIKYTRKTAEWSGTSRTVENIIILCNINAKIIFKREKRRFDFVVAGSYISWVPLLPCRNRARRHTRVHMCKLWKDISRQCGSKGKCFVRLWSCLLSPK